MKFKKSISSIVSGILSVAIISSLFASSAFAASYVRAAKGNDVINEYTVNGVKNYIKTGSGYDAQATRDSKKLTFSVPKDTTKFYLSVDGMSLPAITKFTDTKTERLAIIDASKVDGAFVSSNGCFKKGKYEYSASNETASSPDTLMFRGMLYVDNTADSNKTPKMAYDIDCIPWSSENYYFPYKTRPDTAKNTQGLKLSLSNYVGEYYYVVCWQPDAVESRSIFGQSVLPPAIEEPSAAYPIYVSPMLFADEINPVNCVISAEQGITTFGGNLPKGAYIFKIYNAAGERVYANDGYTDENMANITNDSQTVDYKIPSVEPVKTPKPIITPVKGEPVSATVDGDKIPVSDVVVKPDGTVDLTDKAKNKLPKGPHKLVVTFDDGTKKEATVNGKKEPAPASATLDGNKIPVSNVIKNPDGTYDLTDDAKKNISNGPHKLVVTLDNGTKKEVTVYGAGGVEGFVARLYRVVLERQPDPVGHKAWVDALKNRVELADGSGTANGLSTALGFFESPEFLGKNVSDDDFIRRCYKTFFDREPDAAGYAQWKALLKKGVSRRDIIKGFANSNEWVMLCWSFDINSGAAGVPDTAGIKYNKDVIQFTDRLYKIALGRPGDPIGVTAWSIVLIKNQGTGSDVARGFFFSDEFVKQNVSDKEFITRLYGVFLNRQPDAQGLADWTKFLNQTDREKTFDAFTSNAEWKAVCEKYGIKP